MFIRIIRSFWNLAGICQISRWYRMSNYQSRGCETSRDLTIRCDIGYWNGHQGASWGTTHRVVPHRRVVVQPAHWANRPEAGYKHTKHETKGHVSLKRQDPCNLKVSFGLVQQRRDSIASAMESRLSCTNPLILPQSKSSRSDSNRILQDLLFLVVPSFLRKHRGWQGPAWLGHSMSWLLMTWQREEPGHQQPWYWSSCPRKSNLSTRGIH